MEVAAAALKVYNACQSASETGTPRVQATEIISRFLLGVSGRVPGLVVHGSIPSKQSQLYILYAGINAIWKEILFIRIDMPRIDLKILSNLEGPLRSLCLSEELYMDEITRLESVGIPDIFHTFPYFTNNLHFVHNFPVRDGNGRGNYVFAGNSDMKLLRIMNYGWEDGTNEGEARDPAHRFIQIENDYVVDNNGMFCSDVTLNRRGYARISVLPGIPDAHIGGLVEFRLSPVPYYYVSREDGHTPWNYNHFAQLANAVNWVKINYNPNASLHLGKNSGPVPGDMRIDLSKWYVVRPGYTLYANVTDNMFNNAYVFEYRIVGMAMGGKSRKIPDLSNSTISLLALLFKKFHEDDTDAIDIDDRRRRFETYIQEIYARNITRNNILLHYAALSEKESEIYAELIYNIYKLETEGIRVAHRD
jgi:hypothetical protein